MKLKDCGIIKIEEAKTSSAIAKDYIFLFSNIYVTLKSLLTVSEDVLHDKKLEKICGDLRTHIEKTYL